MSVGGIVAIVLAICVGIVAFLLAVLMIIHIINIAIDTVQHKWDTQWRDDWEQFKIKHL